MGVLKLRRCNNQDIHWSENIGHSLIKSVELTIGSQTVQEMVACPCCRKLVDADTIAWSEDNRYCFTCAFVEVPRIQKLIDTQLVLKYIPLLDEIFTDLVVITMYPYLLKSLEQGLIDMYSKDRKTYLLTCGIDSESMAKLRVILN